MVLDTDGGFRGRESDNIRFELYLRLTFLCVALLLHEAVVFCLLVPEVFLEYVAVTHLGRSLRPCLLYRERCASTRRKMSLEDELFLVPLFLKPHIERALMTGFYARTDYSGTKT